MGWVGVWGVPEIYGIKDFLGKFYGIKDFGGKKREIYGIKVPSAAGATEAVQCGTSGNFSPAAALFHVNIINLSTQILDQDCLCLSSSISE